MTKESISNKLSELFELLKSGALTKEEFEKLKKQILSEDGVENTESVKKKEKETANKPDNQIRAKKGSRFLIFSIIATVFLVAVFLVLLPKNDGDAKDQDGNMFKTVKIGNQFWMAENLDVNTFRNGDPIPEAETENEWMSAGNEHKPAWSYYNNDPENGKIYGKLYNWYSGNDQRGLAPIGWHIPSSAEWATLKDYLKTNGFNWDGTTSGDEYGKSLAATKYWNLSTGKGDVGNTDFPQYRNKTGFSAVAGGSRDVNGKFGSIGEASLWWSFTARDASTAGYCLIPYNACYLASTAAYKNNGYSVRCLRDN